VYRIKKLKKRPRSKGLYSHTKREREREFENRVLRRIFGSKINEVTEGWRKLHNEEFHNLQSSANISRAIKSRRI
jgi:transposase